MQKNSYYTSGCEANKACSANDADEEDRTGPVANAAGPLPDQAEALEIPDWVNDYIDLLKIYRQAQLTKMYKVLGIPREEVDWLQHFELMYEALSVLGWCDRPGGAESVRLRDEARVAGRPVGDELARFIHERANV